MKTPAEARASWLRYAKIASIAGKGLGNEGAYPTLWIAEESRTAAKEEDRVTARQLRYQCCTAVYKKGPISATRKCITRRICVRTHQQDEVYSHAYRDRELIIGNSNLQKDDVLITSGAVGALFIISTSQLTKDDYLLVMRPNYATNLETPKAIGCDITYINLALESSFQPDLSKVQRALKPNTKIVSITAPHNPTGTAISRKTLDQFVALTKQSGCLLLVDETYRDVSYTNPLPIAATLGDHVISVSSLSKSYGLPGIRIGWLITPNSKLQETFLAAKEQISISGSVFDEWVAEQVLARKQEILRSTNTKMEKRLSIVEAWIEKEDLLEWVRPEGGVVCFPHMKEEPVRGTKAF